MPIHDIDRHYIYLTTTEAELLGRPAEPAHRRIRCSESSEITGFVQMKMKSIYTAMQGRESRINAFHAEDMYNRLSFFLHALVEIGEDGSHPDFGAPIQ